MSGDPDFEAAWPGNSYIEALRGDQRQRAETYRGYAASSREHAAGYREMAEKAEANAARLEVEAKEFDEIAAAPDIEERLRANGYFGPVAAAQGA